MKNSKGKGISDEYGTPQVLFDIYNDEFGFNLDVCASAKNHKCKKYWTKDDDGLAQIWGEVNWCNPPYSNQLPWIEKAVNEKLDGFTATVLLLKYDPSTKHGQLIAEEADEIRIVEHRIKFEGALLGANFPSVFVVVRPRLYTRKSGAKIFYVNYKELLG